MAVHSFKAQILQQGCHVIPERIKVTEHIFKVPLDYSKQFGESIRLFARSAERVKMPADMSEDAEEKLPWFLFLTGGPGFGCHPVKAGGWTDFVMDKGYKVLLLDQRGNGLSNTITTELLLRRGGPEEQAAYLKHFRADNIVKDAEAIRSALTEGYPDHKSKWSVMGQSFGGFCAVHYLSKYPEGLREVFTTGGLPPLTKQPDTAYEKLVRRIARASQQYYEKFPEDIERMHRIVEYVSNKKVITPTDGILSPGRIQNLGMALGASGGTIILHNLILRMNNDLDMFGHFTRPTLSAVDQQGSFDDNIIYAIMHESIYVSRQASNWSAERAIQAASGFETTKVKQVDPILFTAEMVTHDTFETNATLRPLLPAAEILAKDTDWPDLYDEKQLAANKVPMYAATYFDDLYVDFDFAQDTASKIKGCKVFIKNTLFHNAIGSNATEVMEELWKLRDDVIY